MRTINDDYDFADAKRGMFFREHAALVPPVHLEPEVLEYLKAQATARGVTLNALVNTLLREDIERIEAAE